MASERKKLREQSVQFEEALSALALHAHGLHRRLEDFNFSSSIAFAKLSGQIFSSLSKPHLELLLTFSIGQNDPFFIALCLKHGARITKKNLPDLLNQSALSLALLARCEERLEQSNDDKKNQDSARRHVAAFQNAWMSVFSHQYPCATFAYDRNRWLATALRPALQHSSLLGGIRHLFSAGATSDVSAEEYLFLAARFGDSKMFSFFDRGHWHFSSHALGHALHLLLDNFSPSALPLEAMAFFIHENQPTDFLIQSQGKTLWERVLESASALYECSEIDPLRKDRLSEILLDLLSYLKNALDDPAPALQVRNTILLYASESYRNGLLLSSDEVILPAAEEKKESVLGVRKSVCFADEHEDAPFAKRLCVNSSDSKLPKLSESFFPLVCAPIESSSPHSLPSSTFSFSALSSISSPRSDGSSLS